MTTTAVRPASTVEATPESQDLALLEQRLQDPTLAGFRKEIQAAIDELRAKTFVADLAA